MEISPEALFAATKLNNTSRDQLRNGAIAGYDAVDHISEPISYEEFFTNYLLPNKLCVLGSWATEKWRSRQEWIVKGENRPDLSYIREKFGDAKCPVADCKQEKYSSHPKNDMTVAEYMNYLEKYSTVGNPADEKCLYLKDWHFQKEFPDYKAYEVPVFFASDWVNEYWDSREDLQDDYRFVYIGPKGSWTPFHADVLRSFSWSANICGRKQWTFFPPGEEDKLRDAHGQLPFDLTSPDLEGRSVDTDAARSIVVYQEAGELVFVPSGWHHQVLNLEDTISINHNWMNACNIDLCWRHLVNSMADVQKEILDCRDMEGWAAQCQLVLKASAGMDYADFYRFLSTIAETRLDLLQSSSETIGTTPKTASVAQDPTEHSEDSKKNINHYIFDLIRIRDLVSEMKRNKEFLQVDFDQFHIRPKRLILRISNIVDKWK